MARPKNLGTPDESIQLPGIVEDLVEVGDLTVGRVVQQPGWRWSKDVQPIVGGEWCQARHVGVILSGRMGVLLQDGSTIEYGPNDVYDIPPGHDGYTVGDEPSVAIEWSGLRTFAGHRIGFHGRKLATLLFTDLVDSTATAVQMGDIAWREVLARHYQAVRSALDRAKGREVKTTGDGMLALFDGPAVAIRCAVSIRDAAGREGLQIRAGVHVGEVELMGNDVHGVAVHEAARIMAEADANEILVSETTRTLAAASGLAFEDRGVREMKGFPAPQRLFAFVGTGVSEPPATTG